MALAGLALAGLTAKTIVESLMKKENSGPNFAKMLESQEKQRKEKEAENKKNIEAIMSKNAKDQKAALKKHQEEAEKSLKAQQDKFNQLEKERSETAKKEMDNMKAKMDKEYQEQQKQMDDKIAALSEKQAEERKRLLAVQAEEKKQFDDKVNQLESHMAEREEEHKQKLEEMIKIVEKKNYESHYPMPESLKDHYAANPNSFNIQILGCRGAGKSTFVNKFMIKAKMGKVAQTGSNETTIKTAFYEITQKVENKPDRYENVFICDQPGIGGLKITEAGYLNDFGPGHFNFTLMLGEKGFNELDMSLLKHLLHNKKPVAFVRTQCDSAVAGIKDAYEEENDGDEISTEEAKKTLQESFHNYIQKDVLELVDLDNMEIFYVGIPPKEYPDFEKLTRYVLGGDLLHETAKTDPHVNIDNM